ncbi:MAG TPA: hypothetical protein VMS92_22545 [Mycobacterium sp.]|nr:hypothetical protein [Mycobacterium sp.]
MSTPTSRAGYVRGGLVGLCAALVTAAAHAGAGGGVPTGGALVLLLVVCATVGAAVGGIRLEGRVARAALVIGALAAAQALGHVMLTVGGHHEHTGWLMTAPMLMLHVLAAVGLGLLIDAVDYLFAVCGSVLCWLRIFTAGHIRPAAGQGWRSTNVIVARPVLLRTGLGMRAPPRVSFVSA